MDPPCRQFSSRRRCRSISGTRTVLLRRLLIYHVHERGIEGRGSQHWVTGWGTKLALVDEKLNLIAEPGQVGEILLGGPGLASGYIDRPKENQESFVTLQDGAASENLESVGYKGLQIKQGDFFARLVIGTIQLDGCVPDPSESANGVRGHRLCREDNVADSLRDQKPRQIVQSGCAGSSRLANL